jgi:hypothetical protein
MRTTVGILVAIALALSAGTVSAATYFKYRDQGAGCDAFVSPLLLFLANVWRVFAWAHGYGHA